MSTYMPGFLKEVRDWERSEKTENTIPPDFILNDMCASSEGWIACRNRPPIQRIKGEDRISFKVRITQYLQQKWGRDHRERQREYSDAHLNPEV